MADNICNESTNDANLVPSLDELRMTLQNCGSSLRAKDFQSLVNYLQFLTDLYNGNIAIIPEAIITEQGDALLELENANVTNGIIVTEASI